MRFLKYLIIFSGLSSLVLYGWYQYELDKSPAISDRKIFTVAANESVKEIADKLSAGGFIDSKLAFLIYIWQTDKDTRLQAGEYVFSPADNIKEIVAALSAGKAASQEKTITIIEGWNIDDIGNYLKGEKIEAANDFISLAGKKINDWPFSFPRPEFLKTVPLEADLEGFLFPDTYRIFKDSSAEEIIKKMLDNFDSKLDAELSAVIVRQGRNLYEIITMASLVEKEVKSEADMKIVAGIFYDRIKYGQPLESCATLAYILGVNKPQYTLEDTQIESPYNTYRRQGLPPSPIANPGLKAIRAAIYPEFTDYNYFLTRPDTGATVFSRTYDEHLLNKNKYLR
jgi:UPF0755 protein